MRGENKFASRTLDFDLLTWDDLVDEKQGVLWNEILRFAFVLRLLADVAPDELYPGPGVSYADLWRALQGKPQGMYKVFL